MREKKHRILIFKTKSMKDMTYGVCHFDRTMSVTSSFFLNQKNGQNQNGTLNFNHKNNKNVYI